MMMNDIGQLEATRRDAMLTANLAVLADVLADDLVWVHASSKMDSKTTFLQKFERGALRCFRLDHSDVAIRIHGVTALVTGKVEMDVAVDGERRVAANRYVAAWVVQHSGAKLALWQSTRQQD